MQVFKIIVSQDTDLLSHRINFHTGLVHTYVTQLTPLGAK